MISRQPPCSRVRMVRCVRYGPHALLIRFAGGTSDHAFGLGRAIATELSRHPPAGLIEIVPGFTTTLLRFDPLRVDLLADLVGTIEARVSALTIGDAPSPAPIKEIPVVYDGEDLEALAAAKDLSIDDVVRLHSAPVYDVRLLGFSPGFPYLGKLDPRLHTPRRQTPRPRVAAGSVAVGGEHTGIYSIDSPGGWHIIGRAPVRLFRHERVEADTDPRDVFLLLPGDRVRFVPVSESRLSAMPDASSAANEVKDFGTTRADSA